MKREVYESGGYVAADHSVIPNSKRPPSRHKVPPNGTQKYKKKMFSIIINLIFN